MGDVLRVVSEGAEKPTNIMFRANLTWPLTVAYVETLVRHEMLRVDVNGNRVAYHVTPKGSALLRSFIETVEAAAELRLETMDSAILSRVSASKPKAKSEAPTSLDAIRETLEREGYGQVPKVRQGLSGVEHGFDMIMSNGKGARIGYITSETGGVGDIIRAFILQTDCEFQVRVLCLAPPDVNAKELAASYNIALMPARNSETLR